MSQGAVTASSSDQKRSEWIWLVALLATIGLSAAYRLSEFIVPDSDEGIYVYAGKLIAEGQWPYRDFMLAHPPGVALVAALFWIIGDGSLAVTRWLTILLTLGSCVPLYFLARRLSREPVAGLIAIATYCAGLIWIANLGRTVRLEPMLNALFISGVAMWLLRTSRASGFWTGVLLGASVAVKLVAVVPIAFIALAELLWPTGKPDWKRRGLVAAGALAILVPVALIYARDAEFFDWVIRAQGERARDLFGDRLRRFVVGMVRYPPLLLAFLVALWQLTRPEPRRRMLALLSVGGLLASVFGFNTFYRHYLAVPLPFFSVLLAVWLIERLGPARARLLRVAAFTLGLVGPISYTELSFHTSPEHSIAAARVLPYVRRRDDLMFTTAPDFALLTGRQLVPGYFIVDTILGRVTGRLTDAQIAESVARAGTVVLFENEILGLPQTRRVLDAQFRSLPAEHWGVWERIGNAEPAP